MMSRLRYAVLLSCLLALTGACSRANTCTKCYIDYENGNDANSGADTSHPWKHLPGMTGGASNGADACSVSCAAQSPKAGDSYVLKGGVVWPYTVFPLNWVWAGSSTTSSYGCAGAGCIYIGVDQSWNKGIVNSVIPSRDYGGCPGSLSVSLTGGGGEGASAVAKMVGHAVSFGNGGYYVGYYTVTSQGSGYSSNPNVVVNGPGCTSSQAVADIYRAVFDFGGTSGVVWNSTMAPNTGLVYLANAGKGKFTIWDSIEMRHAAFDKTTASNHNVFQSDNAPQVTANNLFIHDWGITARNTGGGDGSYAIWMNNNNGSPAMEEISNSWINNAERIVPCTITANSPTLCSEGNVSGGGTIHNSHLMFYVWMVQSTSNVHDNEIWGNTASDNGGHTNMFYLLTASPVKFVYNNVFHDNDAGSSSQMGQGASTTWYVFNNVCWLCGAGGSVFGIDTNFPPPSGNSYFYFWNNTFYAPGGHASCINSGGAGAPNMAGLNIHLYNNQCITDQTSEHWFTMKTGTAHTVNGVTSPSTSTADNANLVMSPASAASQGYTVVSRWQPTSSSDATVVASGANLTNATPGCAAVSALCADVMGNKRPAVGPWNAGAYLFVSGAKPNPPASLSATPH